MAPTAANAPGVCPGSDGEWDCVEREVREFGAISIEFTPKVKEKYPAKLHAHSVVKHLGVKQGLIYLPGQVARMMEDSDMPEAFHQRRYFYYMSGVEMPDCVLTYNIQKDQLTLFIPPPTTGTSVIFNGSLPSKEEVAAKYEVDVVLYTSCLTNHLNNFAHKEYGKIYVLDESQSPRGKIAQNITFRDGQRSNLYISPIENSKLKTAMNNARCIKSSHEIKLLRKACDISALAHTYVLEEIKNLRYETQIEAIFVGTCIGQGAKQQAYGVIAGSGENAAILHYMSNTDSLEGKQLVCLDAGAEWKLYASDVTRSFPISGKYTPEAQAIYDIVAEMQDSCIEMIKPGANMRDMHMHAHKVATLGLMDLGILHNGTYEELYDSGVSTAFFLHGLGHHVGLEVHDVEGTPGNLLYGMKDTFWLTNFHEMRKDPSATVSVLSPNMVITVEPGIYFSRYALDLYSKDKRFSKYINTALLDKYYPVGGVRIEDCILVTEDGYDNITTAPKGEAALKIINGETEVLDAEKKKKGWFW